MSNLKKFFVLAAALVLALSVGADNALAQTFCGVTATSVKVRSEGLTEKVADINVNCRTSAAALPAQEDFWVEVEIQNGVNITNTIRASNDEIAAGIQLIMWDTSDPSVPADLMGGGLYQLDDKWIAGDDNGLDDLVTTANGKVTSDSKVRFFFDRPVSVANSGLRMRIMGIRVDATGGNDVTAEVSVAGPDLWIFDDDATVAEPETGLTATVQGGAIEGMSCTSSAAITAGGLTSNDHADIVDLRLKEGFANAFQANDRIMLTFSDIPSGVKAYLRPGDKDGDGDDGDDGAGNDICGGDITMQLLDRLDGTAAMSENTKYEFVEVSLSSGSGTAYYKITDAGTGTVEDCDIPIYFQRGVGAGLGAGTVAGSFAPVSTINTASVSTVSVPRFMDTSIDRTAISLRDCSTTLLFPFVTNQSGFDTGIVISNTSEDPLSTSEHEGTCEIHYYGSMTGGGTAPSAMTSNMIGAGEQLIFLVSGGSEPMGISGAAGFQGYLMAQCSFQFAHGLAFITDGFGVGAANLAHGYLALVVPLSPNGQRMTGAGGTEELNN